MKMLPLIKLLLLTSLFMVVSSCTPNGKSKETLPYDVDPNLGQKDSTIFNGSTSPHYVPNPKELDSLKQEAKKKRKG